MKNIVLVSNLVKNSEEFYGRQISKKLKIKEKGKLYKILYFILTWQ